MQRSIERSAARSYGGRDHGLQISSRGLVASERQQAATGGVPPFGDQELPAMKAWWVM
jgi:hypothetical protein